MFKLTQNIKTKWLNALKSGKFKQTKCKLKDETGHCCLGVLAEVHPKLKIDRFGKNCVVNGKTADYKPFNEMFGEAMTNRLYSENDRSYNKGSRDYSAVIPMIEELPTTK